MKKVITIEGMSCGHCSARVKRELEGLSGVKSVDVDLASKKATVELANEIDDQKLVEAVTEAGYEAVSVE